MNKKFILKFKHIKVYISTNIYFYRLKKGIGKNKTNRIKKNKK